MRRNEEMVERKREKERVIYAIKSTNMWIGVMSVQLLIREATSITL